MNLRFCSLAPLDETDLEERLQQAYQYKDGKLYWTYSPKYDVFEGDEAGCILSQEGKHGNGEREAIGEKTHISMDATPCSHPCTLFHHPHSA
jgi:hypothetical protein